MHLSSFTNSGYFMHDYVLLSPHSLLRTNLLLAQTNTYMTWQTSAQWQKQVLISYHSTTITVKSCFSHIKLCKKISTNMHSQRQVHPSNLHCVIHATKAGRNRQRSWEASCMVLTQGKSILWKGFTKKSVGV